MFSVPEIKSFSRELPNKDWKFSIIIPSWNNLSFLKFCIESIEKNSFFKHQIIVHINEGEDGSLAWIADKPYDYTFSAQNAGVCYAVNSMARLVKTDYIVYLNDDMVVSKNWDVALNEFIRSQNSDLFYVSGTMVEPKYTGNKCVEAPFDFGSTPSNFNEVAFNKFLAEKNIANWSGACWPPSLVSKRLWDLVGGYDENFSPGFYSDPDFAMKLWNSGVRTFVGLGNCVVYHFQSKSTGRVTANNGRKMFAQKWGIPSSVFYKKYLKMGKNIVVIKPLKDPGFLTVIWARLKATYIKLS